MAGIYIHIPYCKKICFYCDFHFSLNLKTKNEMINAILSEIRLQKDYLGKSKVETIYFGGGTPSVLSADEINLIVEEIYKNFDLKINPECTLECNPDDLSYEYLSSIRNNTLINRLSIGVQSFFDDDLKVMNRRHTGNEAFISIENSINAGFSNITVDLIYGMPSMTIDKVKSNIDSILKYKVNHISTYCLTVEPNTAFNHFVKQKKISLPNDDETFAQYSFIIEYLKSHGFIHYEISNFAKGNFLSKHNISYWKQKKYIGFGPSAHSYNGKSRQWNISHNSKYIQSINNNKLPCTVENLSLTTRYNEYIMTALRTMWGINLEYISNNFGKMYYDYCIDTSNNYIISKDILMLGNYILLSDKGKYISDSIISQMFYIGKN